MRGITALALWTLMLAGCDTRLARYEGTAPGDCSDGADNDGDTRVDCADPSCAGSEGCAALPSDGGGISNATVFPERDFLCEEGALTPCQTTRAAHSVEARSLVESDVVRNDTLTFVMNTISIPQSTGDTAAGFNLDALDSGSGSSTNVDCQAFQSDLRSSLDPDHIGVDNMYQSLVSTVEMLIPPENCPGGVTAGCMDALLQQEVDAGSTLLIEVSGVDDLENDSDVTVALFDATSAGTPSLVGGRLAPDQNFFGAPIGQPVHGDIFHGRVRVLPVTFTLLGGETGLLASVHDAELRFDISETGLSNGQIGGAMFVGEMLAQVPVEYQEAARSILESNADLLPSEDPRICRAMSIGITFGATTAFRTP